MNQRLRSPVRSLISIYIISITIVALFTISGHFFVDKLLDDRESDSKINQVIAKQRDISQKITKTVLLFQAKDNSNQRGLYLKHLKQLLTSFNENHKKNETIKI